MSEELEVPEWCVPGAKVAEMSDYAGSVSVNVAVIKSVGKRYVVMASGDRYDRGRMERQAGGAYGRWYRLLPLSDERVRAAVREGRRVKSAGAASELINKWRQDARPEFLAEALDLLAPFVEVSS